MAKGIFCCCPDWNLFICAHHRFYFTDMMHRGPRCAENQHLWRMQPLFMGESQQSYRRSCFVLFWQKAAEPSCVCDTRSAVSTPELCLLCSAWQELVLPLRSNALWLRRIVWFWDWATGRTSYFHTCALEVNSSLSLLLSDITQIVTMAAAADWFTESNLALGSKQKADR